MNRSYALLAGALIAALCQTSVRAAIDRVVEKSFTVQPNGILRVATSGGDIRVETGDDTSVKVVAHEHVRADSDAEADELLQKLTLTIDQDGDRITAQAEYEKQSSGFHWGSWPPVHVDFVVTVPARFAAELQTSGGDIVVGDLAGPIRAHTSGGNERFGKIAGEIDAATSGGNIALEAGAGKISLSTSGGNISVGYAGGPAELRTSGGNLKIDGAASTVEARTSGGNVTAVFTGRLRGDCVLATSGGRVRATVPAGTGFHLNASTSGGEVRADGLTITIEGGGLRRSSLVGAVAGGGPELRLRSSGGDVEIAVAGGS